MNKDLFGYENQKENYAIYRPKYPSSFIKEILNSSTNLDNYLDIATGTGSLLFNLSQNFKKIKMGIDKSEVQLSVALNKLKENPLYSDIQIKCCDVLELPKILNEENLNNSFDLITIGQALHWMNFDETMQEIKKNMLKLGGTLAITGYYSRGYTYNLEDENLIQSEDNRYWKWYNKIDKFFECDREAISTGYKNYEFNKYFNDFKKIENLDRNEATLIEFIKYLKTFSAYNRYLELNKGNNYFVDDTIQLEKEIFDDIENFKKNGVKFKSDKPLVMLTYFFLIILK